MSELASRAVESLSAVSAIGIDVCNDHPMRHQIRLLKSVAERTLADAFCISYDLAMQANQLIRDYDKSLIEYSKEISNNR